MTAMTKLLMGVILLAVVLPFVSAEVTDRIVASCDMSKNSPSSQQQFSASWNMDFDSLRGWKDYHPLAEPTVWPNKNVPGDKCPREGFIGTSKFQSASNVITNYEYYEICDNECSFRVGSYNENDGRNWLDCRASQSYSSSPFLGSTSFFPCFDYLALQNKPGTTYKYTRPCVGEKIEEASWDFLIYEQSFKGKSRLDRGVCGCVSDEECYDYHHNYLGENISNCESWKCENRECKKEPINEDFTCFPCYDEPELLSPEAKEKCNVNSEDYSENMDELSCQNWKCKSGKCEKFEFEKIPFNCVSLQSWMEPDFFSSEFDNKEIKYSEVFPARLNCTVSIELPGYEKGKEFEVSFSFFKYDSGWFPLTVPETKTCRNKDNCTFFYPEKWKEKIKPDDTLLCRAYVLKEMDNDELPLAESVPVTIPSFDILIKDAYFLNVVPIRDFTQDGEEQTLVKGKPAIERIILDFESNKISIMDVPVEIKQEGLANKIPQTVLGEQYKSKEMLVAELEAELNKGKDAELEKVREITGKIRNIKNGKDGITLFNISSDKQIVKYSVIIDPENKIAEGNEENNNLGGEISFVENNKNIFIRVYPVLISSEPETWPYPADDEGNFPADKEQEIVSNMNRQFEFTRSVFPVKPENADIEFENFLSMPILENSDLLDYKGENRRNPEPLKTQERIKLMEKIQIKILESLKNEKKDDKIVIGLVDERILGKKSINDKGEAYITYFAGGYYPDYGVILLSYGAAENSVNALAHELYHYYVPMSTLEQEDYSLDPIGFLASDGWCLEQKSGKSCSGENAPGARVNIWKRFDGTSRLITQDNAPIELSSKVRSLLGEKVDTLAPLINLNFGQRFFDIGARTLDKRRENAWINENRYETLLKIFSDWTKPFGGAK